MSKRFNEQPYRMSFYLGFAFSAGLMASPDNFVRLGNFLGQSGFAGLFLIFLFALFYVLILRTTPQQFSCNFQDQYNFSTIFAFCVRLIALSFIATALLVTSGFVFNEVFLYWFPNFGFAFILLGMLLGIQFLPKKIIGLIQTILISISIAVLLIIMVSALMKLPAQNYFSEYWSLDGLDISRANFMVTPLLLFVGFDLGLNIYSQTGVKNSSFTEKGAITAIIFFAILFVFWGFISMYIIPKEKLLTTTIPHIITAKIILGNPGRYLMGLMVISGSMAAVNSIFSNISCYFNSNHGTKNTTKKYKKIILLITSITIGIMMAGGLAGDDKIDIYVKAVLILWLISYGVSMLSSHLERVSNDFLCDHSTGNKNRIIELILWISILILIITDKNLYLLLSFLLPALIIVFSISFLIYIANRHKHKF